MGPQNRGGSKLEGEDGSLPALAFLQGLQGKSSQPPPSPPVPASHQGKAGAKSPWIWPSGAQKCHLGQMPAPFLQLEGSTPFSELLEPFICVSASKTHEAANLVTGWLVFSW